MKSFQPEQLMKCAGLWKRESVFFNGRTPDISTTSRTGPTSETSWPTQPQLCGFKREKLGRGKRGRREGEKENMKLGE